MKVPQTIFYADDDADDRDFFREILDSLGRLTDLYTLNCGDTLLSALQNPPPSPQLVFLDLNMPGKNGFEVLEEIRSNNSLKKVPVVIFSTSDDYTSVEKTRLLGANRYLRKPTSYSKFKRTISEILEVDWDRFQADKANYYIS